MPWELEFEDAFGRWWIQLTLDQQEAVDFYMQLLALHGPSIGSPIDASATGQQPAPVYEIRVLHEGCTHRVVFTAEAASSTLVLLEGTTVDGLWIMWDGAVVKASAVDA